LCQFLDTYTYIDNDRNFSIIESINFEILYYESKREESLIVKEKQNHLYFHNCG